MGPAPGLAILPVAPLIFTGYAVGYRSVMREVRHEAAPSTHLGVARAGGQRLLFVALTVTDILQMPEQARRFQQ